MAPRCAVATSLPLSCATSPAAGFDHVMIGYQARATEVFNVTSFFRLFPASQSPFTFRHVRLTMSLPTAPPSGAPSQRR